MRHSQWLYETCSSLLALLFLYTALSKLFDVHLFVHEINNQPFDKRFTPILVFGLPLAELIAVILLLLPKYRIKGLFLSLLMMIAFTIYVAMVTLHFYKRVPCACAGVFRQMSWPQHLIFNILFTVPAVLGITIYYKQKGKKDAPACQGL